MLHPSYRLQDILFRGVVLRHVGRAQHRQTHAAGEVSGIDHRDVFKGFGRLHGVLVALADVPCHRNVDDVSFSAKNRS